MFSALKKLFSSKQDKGESALVSQKMTESQNMIDLAVGNLFTIDYGLLGIMEDDLVYRLGNKTKKITAMSDQPIGENLHQRRYYTDDGQYLQIVYHSGVCLHENIEMMHLMMYEDELPGAHNMQHEDALVFMEGLKYPQNNDVEENILRIGDADFSLPNVFVMQLNERISASDGSHYDIHNSTLVFFRNATEGMDEICVLNLEESENGEHTFTTAVGINLPFTSITKH